MMLMIMTRYALLLVVCIIAMIKNEYSSFTTTSNFYCNGFTTTKTTSVSSSYSSLKQHHQQQQLLLYKQIQPQHPYLLQQYASTLPKENEQIEVQQVNGKVVGGNEITTATTFLSTNNDTDTSTTGTTMMGWECTDDVSSCVEVPICVVDDNDSKNDDETCSTTMKSTSLDVRIHNVWYDVSGWRKHHPAGTHWIDYYQGRDATEVMDGFHTIKAQEMYKRLPKSKLNIQNQLQSNIPNDTTTQLNFRKLRIELENNGYWERNMIHEYQQLGIWSSLVIGASILAHVPISSVVFPIVSCILLALSMTAAGWLGHDYIHGIDPFANKLRNFAAIAAGLAPIWWSDKHNKHHALTNEQGVDEDIATDPFLYTWAPDPSQDSPLRKIQHYIFWIPFSALFALWRIDSIKSTIDAIEQKRPNAKNEMYCLLIHYAILFTIFPISIWLPAIFLSGLLSALIVTPTHQSEMKFNDYQPDWVTAQFLSTRNAITTNPFSEWIWGGMQYQLEHHLFPSMPRNKYPKLRTILQQFVKDNNIPGGYRETNEFEILKMNWLLYKSVAEADAVPGAPLTRGRPGQIGAIN